MNTEDNKQVDARIEKAIDDFKKSLKMHVYVNQHRSGAVEVDVRLYSDGELIASDDDEVYLESN